ncbi:MAG TPA: VanZ family protein [Bryobacteraceae bacterium]|nr:VanZ family protein [Bryobacteraceae bacterium]
MIHGQPPRLPFRHILAIVVALIVYGSLYPWQFRMRPLYASPPWILLHSWPSAVNRFVAWDFAVNMVLYMPLGIFAVLAVSETAPRLVRVFWPLALAFALSASIEMLQLFDDSRTCSLADLTSNVVGAAVGIGAGEIYRARWQRIAVRLRLSGGLLLLSCWLGYQIFPLFPSWGRTRLSAKIAAMQTLPAGWPTAVFVVFAEWLAVACLLDSVLGAKARRTLALLLLVLPARLFIAGRTLTWSEIAGAAAAGAVWVWLPRRRVRRAVPFVMAAALVVSELAPFHFAGAQAFNWVPFRGFFQMRWQDGFVVLFRKSFAYGAVLWLWRDRLARTTAVAALALFVLERAQIYLPGRTPEITDAVLAILMGLLLWLLRDV